MEKTPSLVCAPQIARMTRIPSRIQRLGLTNRHSGSDRVFRRFSYIRVIRAIRGLFGAQSRLKLAPVSGISFVGATGPELFQSRDCVTSAAVEVYRLEGYRPLIFGERDRKVDAPRERRRALPQLS